MNSIDTSIKTTGRYSSYYGPSAVETRPDPTGEAMFEMACDANSPSHGHIRLNGESLGRVRNVVIDHEGDKNIITVEVLADNLMWNSVSRRLLINGVNVPYVKSVHITSNKDNVVVATASFFVTSVNYHEISLLGCQ